MIIGIGGTVYGLNVHGKPTLEDKVTIVSHECVAHHWVRNWGCEGWYSDEKEAVEET